MAENRETVNTTVHEIPVPHYYLPQYNGTTHVVDGREYEVLQARAVDGNTQEITSLCGKVTFDVTEDRSDEPTHYADTFDADEVINDPEMVRRPHEVLVGVCGSCATSLEARFDRNDFGTVRYGLTGEKKGNWSR